MNGYYLGASKIPNPAVDIVGYNNYMDKLRQGINPLVPKLQQVAIQTSRSYGGSYNNTSKYNTEAKLLADYYNQLQQQQNAEAVAAAEEAANMSNYNNPNQTNSLADLLLNWGGWTSKGFGNMLKEYWNYNPLHQLLKGNGTAAFNNGLTALGEDLDILANPFKAILQSAPNTLKALAFTLPEENKNKDTFEKLSQSLLSTVGLSEEAGIGARVNHDWDTGNSAADFALEIVSDPVNLIKGATGAATKSITRGVVKNNTDTILKRTCGELIGTAVAAGEKSFTVRDIQSGYEFIIKNLTGKTTAALKTGASTGITDISTEILEKANKLNFFKLMSNEELDVVKQLTAELGKAADVKLVSNVTDGLVKIYKNADKIDNTILRVGLTDLGVLPTVKLIKYVAPTAKLAHIKLNKATTKANQFLDHWDDASRAAQQKINMASIPISDLNDVMEIYKIELGTDEAADIVSAQLNNIVDNFTGANGVLTNLAVEFRKAKTGGNIFTAMQHLSDFCKANGCSNFYEYKELAMSQIDSVSSKFDIRNTNTKKLLDNITDTYKLLVNMYRDMDIPENAKRIYKELTFGNDLPELINAEAFDNATSLKKLSDSVLNTDSFLYSPDIYIEPGANIKDKPLAPLRNSLQRLVTPEEYNELDTIINQIEYYNERYTYKSKTSNTLRIQKKYAEEFDDICYQFKIKLCTIADAHSMKYDGLDFFKVTDEYKAASGTLPETVNKLLLDDTPRSTFNSLAQPPEHSMPVVSNALSKMEPIRYIVRRAVQKALDATDARVKLSSADMTSKTAGHDDIASRLREEVFTDTSNKINYVCLANTDYPDLTLEEADAIKKAINSVTYGASTEADANLIISKLGNILYPGDAEKLAKYSYSNLLVDLTDVKNMRTVLDAIKSGAFAADVTYKPSILQEVISGYDKTQLRIYKLQPSRLHTTNVINGILKFTDTKYMSQLHEVFDALKNFPDVEATDIIDYITTAQEYTKQWTLYMNLRDKIADAVAAEHLPKEVSDYIVDSLANYYDGPITPTAINNILENTRKYFNTYAPNLNIKLAKGSINNVFNVIEKEYTSIVQNMNLGSKATFTPSYLNILYAVKELNTYCGKLLDTYKPKSKDYEQAYLTLQHYADVIHDYKEALDVADRQIRYYYKDDVSVCGRYMVEYLDKQGGSVLARDGTLESLYALRTQPELANKVFANSSLNDYVRVVSDGQLGFKKFKYDNIFINGIRNANLQDTKELVRKLVKDTAHYTAKEINDAAWLVKNLLEPVQYSATFIQHIKASTPELFQNFSKVYDALVTYVKEHGTEGSQAWGAFNLHVFDEDISDVGWYTVANKLFNSLTYSSDFNEKELIKKQLLIYLKNTVELSDDEKYLMLEILRDPKHMSAGNMAYRNSQSLKEVLSNEVDEIDKLYSDADKEIADEVFEKGNSEKFRQGATKLFHEDSEKLFKLHDNLKDAIRDTPEYGVFSKAYEKNEDLGKIISDAVDEAAAINKDLEAGTYSQSKNLLDKRAAELKDIIHDARERKAKYNLDLFNKAEAARLSNVFNKIENSPEELKRMLINDTCGFMVLSSGIDSPAHSAVKEILEKNADVLKQNGISFYKLNDDLEYMVYLDKKIDAMEKATKYFDGSPEELSFVKTLSNYGVQGSMTSTRYVRYADVQKFYDDLPDELKNLMAYKPDDFNVATSFDWGNLNFDNTFIGRSELISHARNAENSTNVFSFGEGVVKSVGYMLGTCVNNHTLFNAATMLYYSSTSRVTLNNVFKNIPDMEILKALNAKPDYAFVYFKDGKAGKLLPVVVHPTTVKEIEALRKIDPILISNIEARKLQEVSRNSIARRSMGMELLCTVSSLLKASWLSTVGFVTRNLISTTTKALLDAKTVGSTPAELVQVFKKSMEYIHLYEDFYADITEYVGKGSPITNKAIEEFFSKAEVDEALEKYKGKGPELLEVKEWLDHGYTDTLTSVLKNQEEAGVIQGETLMSALKNRETRLQVKYPHMYKVLDDGETLELLPEFKKEHDFHIFNLLATDIAWKNPYTRLLTTKLNGPIETYARYFTYNIHRIAGETKSVAAQAVKNTHFDYAPVTDTEELLNVIIPFINFKVANTKYWLEALYSNPTLARIITATYKVNGAYDMSPEEKISEEGYLNQMLSGGIPIGNSDIYFKLNGDYIDALKVAFNPVDAITDSVLGLKTIKQWVKYKEGAAEAQKELDAALNMRRVSAGLSDSITAAVDNRVTAAQKQVDYYNTTFINLTCSLIPFVNRAPAAIKSWNYVYDEFSEIAENENLGSYLEAVAPLATSVVGTHTEKYYYSWGNLNVASKDYEKYITALEEKGANKGWAGVSQPIQAPTTYYSVEFSNGTEMFTKDTEKLASWLAKGAYPTNDEAKVFNAAYGKYLPKATQPTKTAHNKASKIYVPTKKPSQYRYMNWQNTGISAETKASVKTRAGGKIYTKASSYSNPAKYAGYNKVRSFNTNNYRKGF